MMVNKMKLNKNLLLSGILLTSVNVVSGYNTPPVVTSFLNLLDDPNIIALFTFFFLFILFYGVFATAMGFIGSFSKGNHGGHRAMDVFGHSPNPLSKNGKVVALSFALLSTFGIVTGGAVSSGGYTNFVNRIPQILTAFGSFGAMAISVLIAAFAYYFSGITFKEDKKVPWQKRIGLLLICGGITLFMFGSLMNKESLQSFWTFVVIGIALMIWGMFVKPEGSNDSTPSGSDHTPSDGNGGHDSSEEIGTLVDANTEAIQDVKENQEKAFENIIKKLNAVDNKLSDFSDLEHEIESIKNELANPTLESNEEIIKIMRDILNEAKLKGDKDIHDEALTIINEVENNGVNHVVPHIDNLSNHFKIHNDIKESVESTKNNLIHNYSDPKVINLCESMIDNALVNVKQLNAPKITSELNHVSNDLKELAIADQNMLTLSNDQPAVKKVAQVEVAVNQEMRLLPHQVSLIGLGEIESKVNKYNLFGLDILKSIKSDFLKEALTKDFERKMAQKAKTIQAKKEKLSLLKTHLKNVKHKMGKMHLVNSHLEMADGSFVEFKKLKEHIYYSFNEFKGIHARLLEISSKSSLIDGVNGRKDIFYLSNLHKNKTLFRRELRQESKEIRKIDDLINKKKKLLKDFLSGLNKSGFTNTELGSYINGYLTFLNVETGSFKTYNKFCLDFYSRMKVLSELSGNIKHNMNVHEAQKVMSELKEFVNKAGSIIDYEVTHLSALNETLNKDKFQFEGFIERLNKLETELNNSGLVGHHNGKMNSVIPIADHISKKNPGKHKIFKHDKAN